MAVKSGEVPAWPAEAVDEPTRTRPAAPGRVGPAFPSVRAKLILYFVFLVLAVAVVGVFVLTRLVAVSANERFDNQLREASRAAADSVVRLERAHLDGLRQMAQTDGVWQAFGAGDAASLQNLLAPVALEGGLHVVAAVSLDGQDLLTLYRAPGAAELAASSGADYAGLDIVQKVLSGVSDEQGDKFATVAAFPSGAYLLTSAPVHDAGGTVVGALLAGTRLDSLLTTLKAQTLADVFLLDQQGQLIAATLPEPDEGYGVLALPPEVVPLEGESFNQPLKLYNRDFRALYAPMLVRSAQVGVLGILMPEDFVISTVATSRNTFLFYFIVGTLLFMLVGYSLAQSIAGPIMRLNQAAAAAVRGDFSRRSGLRGNDELGQLGRALDTVLNHLSERTRESRRLYQEVSQRNRALAESSAQLRAAREQLEQSERYAAMGQLAAGIAHDVRDPLRAIVQTSSELRQARADDASLADGLAQIHHHALRANRMLADLLLYARQEPPAFARRDLRQTLERALHATSPLAREAGVKVNANVPDHAVLVEHDAAQIEHVFVNLIRNAVQAMPEGGTLTVGLRRKDNAALIVVQDTGVGIAADQLTRIFEPFYTTRPGGESTGLGLPVSDALVDAHNGRLDVASHPGRGSIFSVWLPLEQPARSPEAEA